MSSVLLRSLSSVRSASRPTVRNFSAGGDQAHHVETMYRWKKITQAAIPVLGAMFVINMGYHFTHHAGHHEEEGKPQYEYLNIAYKTYPWAAKKCTFFDWDCKRKAAAAE